jgi:hypothetical protein
VSGIEHPARLWVPETHETVEKGTNTVISAHLRDIGAPIIQWFTSTLTSGSWGKKSFSTVSHDFGTGLLQRRDTQK